MEHKKENVVKGRRLTHQNIEIFGKPRCKGVAMGFLCDNIFEAIVRIALSHK